MLFIKYRFLLCSMRIKCDINVLLLLFDTLKKFTLGLSKGNYSMEISFLFGSQANIKSPDVIVTEKWVS